MARAPHRISVDTAVCVLVSKLAISLKKMLGGYRGTTRPRPFSYEYIATPSAALLSIAAAGVG